MIFIEIVPDRNEKYFEPYRIYTSSHYPFVPAIILHDPKGTFCLYGSIHSQEHSVDALQVVYHFLMHGGKLMVDSHSPVLIALFASFCIRTSRAILASIYFLLPAIVVPPYMAAVLKMKGLSVRTSHDSVCPDREVNGPKRILMVFPVCCLLLEHGELHVFFHTVLFTKDVVVVRTVSGICDRVLRIKAVDIPELIHKRNKAVHI